MKKVTICVHSLFKNEANWLWYSVSSVIDHVDKVMLWDTGSNDDSYKIAELIKEKYPSKVELKQIGEVSAEDFSSVRQQMLDETKEDWVLIVDADEVWWKESITKLVNEIKNNPNLEMIVNKNINPVGDIFHIVPEKEGKYTIDGRHGFLNIRAMNTKIYGLHVKGEHGVQGYYDNEDKLIQLRDKKDRLYCDYGYMHLTNLHRSMSSILEKKVPKRFKKYKYELGENLPLDFYFPEVFFIERPNIVPSPWNVRTYKYVLLSFMQKPFKFIKNKLQLNKKYGY